MGNRAVLYIVATPIGNLGDLSGRAVEALRDVDLVVCEDTRFAKKVLSHLGIRKPTRSLFAHNERAKADQVLGELFGGKSLAYLTDAGTPLISDPGAYLVRRARKEGIDIIPIPGPSAVTCALQAAGFGADRFLFVGFLPRKGTDRKRAMSEISRFGGPVVIFEAANRLFKTLDDLMDALGEDARLFLAREMTKLHEEYVAGTLGELRSRIEARSEIRGEVTLVVFVEPKREGVMNERLVRRRARRLRGYGLSVRQASEVIRDETGWSKSEVYKEILRVYQANDVEGEDGD